MIIFVQSLRRYNFLIFEIDLIKIFVSSNLLVKKKIVGIDYLSYNLSKTFKQILCCLCSHNCSNLIFLIGL